MHTGLNILLFLKKETKFFKNGFSFSFTFLKRIFPAQEILTGL